MKNTANKNELMERLETVVKHYFIEMLENEETPTPDEWADAYDCFCGCYGTEFDFDENEVMNEAKRIWRGCLMA